MKKSLYSSKISPTMIADMIPTITDEQRQTLTNTTLQDGRNAWEYVNLFEEDKREWVAKAILSCIEKGMKLRPDTISIEAGHLKYGECIITELTEHQKRVCPYPDFWEMKEKGIRFQEFLPPYTAEEVIAEMKARGQYRTTGWFQKK